MQLYFILFAFLCLGTTKVLAQVQDDKGLIAKGAELVLLSNDYTFTEGPVADKKGDVYFTDQPTNRIIKWHAQNGKFTIFKTDAGRSNGLFFDNKENLIACADEKNELWLINKHGKVNVLLNENAGKLLNGPNDVWVHPNGNIYFTDPLYKREYWNEKRERRIQVEGEKVYLFRPDRKVLEVLDADVVKPNGIIGTPDGKYLLIADIGDNKTYRYSINEDGTIGNKVLAAPLGSDGITVDEQENLYLTGNGVTVFDKYGKQIAYIPVPADWVANITFGRKDRKMLFITAGKSVFGLDMNVRGVY